MDAGKYLVSISVYADRLSDLLEYVLNGQYTQDESAHYFLYPRIYKISYLDSETDRKIVNIKPEYETIKNISEETGLTVKEILFVAREKINQMLNEFKNS